MTRILEIGPGDNPLPTATDTLDWPAFKWGETPIPFPDETFDRVYASHVLEHVAWFNVEAALREARRVLKPGGALEVWVPDFEYIAQCYRQRQCGDGWRKHNPEGDPWKWMNGRLFTYGPEPNWHRSAFDGHALIRLTRHAGFMRSMRTVQRPNGHGPMEVGVEATA